MRWKWAAKIISGVILLLAGFASCMATASHLADPWSDRVVDLGDGLRCRLKRFSGVLYDDSWIAIHVVEAHRLFPFVEQDIAAARVFETPEALPLTAVLNQDASGRRIELLRGPETIEVIHLPTRN